MKSLGFLRKRTSVALQERNIILKKQKRRYLEAKCHLISNLLQGGIMHVCMHVQEYAERGSEQGWEMAGQVKYLPCEYEERSSGFQNAHKTQVGGIIGSPPVIPKLGLHTGDP